MSFGSRKTMLPENSSAVTKALVIDDEEMQRES